MNADGSIIALIPARGGSKGVPRKNVKELAGKPLIAYAIQTALASSLIDRVIVSTEDVEIAQIALHYGADDIDGTVVEEHITHDAGATTPQGLTEEELVQLIQEAGRDPVRRDTLYTHLRPWNGETPS